MPNGSAQLPPDALVTRRRLGAHVKRTIEAATSTAPTMPARADGAQQQRRRPGAVDVHLALNTSEDIRVEPSPPPKTAVNRRRGHFQPAPTARSTRRFRRAAVLVAVTVAVA
jgi:hypothetical protein